VTTPNWDESYAASEPPPWDIGRPQPAFAKLAERGLLIGQLLDAGCGTGEHTLLAASAGADAVGADASPLAVQRARAKAAARGIAARFEVADALRLADLGLSFDTVIDSGLFHVFDDDSRRISRDDLRAAFTEGWEISAIQADAFELNPSPFFEGAAAQSWLATIGRTDGSRR